MMMQFMGAGACGGAGPCISGRGGEEQAWDLLLPTAGRCRRWPGDDGQLPVLTSKTTDLCRLSWRKPGPAPRENNPSCLRPCALVRSPTGASLPCSLRCRMRVADGALPPETLSRPCPAPILQPIPGTFLFVRSPTRGNSARTHPQDGFQATSGAVQSNGRSLPAGTAALTGGPG